MIVRTTATAAAPPAIAATSMDLDTGEEEADVEPCSVGFEVIVVSVVEMVVVGPCVATEEGTVNVDVPATTTVCAAAARKSDAGHPCPLHGLLSQQP
jgi:hypothetical protein